MTATITGISIITRPEKWENGGLPRAFFTIDTRGFEIRNCILLQRKDGRLFSLMPRAAESGPRALYCHDHALLDEITSAAKQAFESLGGKI